INMLEYKAGLVRVNLKRQFIHEIHQCADDLQRNWVAPFRYFRAFRGQTDFFSSKPALNSETTLWREYIGR
ncbi:MAG TPA: hypothetical protein VIE65_10140, partial [Methylobacter sp.]